MGSERAVKRWHRDRSRAPASDNGEFLPFPDTLNRRPKTDYQKGLKMRIGLTSDTHLFVDKPVNEKRFKRLIKRMLADGYDIGVHAGDWNGGKHAWRCIEIQCQIIRDLDPLTPWVVTIGNHDVWVRGDWRLDGIRGAHQKPNITEWDENREKIIEIFKKYNMHFIDESPYRDTRFPDTVIVGAMGWYVNPNPATNDHLYLPHTVGGRSPHAFLLSAAWDKLEKGLKQVEPHENLIFLSHFPVIDSSILIGNDHGQWCWSRSIGEHLQNYFNCRYFLCGHSHTRHEGPLRYESGSGVKEISQGGKRDMQHLIVDIPRTDRPG